MFVTVWSPSSFQPDSRSLPKRNINPEIKPFFHGTLLNEAPRTTVTPKETNEQDSSSIIRQVLARYVNQNQRRVLSVDFTQNQAADQGNSEVNSDDILNVVYKKPPFPKKIDLTKLNSRLLNAPAITERRYVFVHGRYWEQLTMNTRSLIGLAAQVKSGGRRVVQPMVKDSSFGNEGKPLGTYFDVAHMNKILAASGYANLVDKEEYVEECLLSNASHVTLHFLYNQEKAEVFTKKKFGLSHEEYKKISKMAKEKGWTECACLEKFLKLKHGSKQFCVDPTVISDWSILERDVLKGVKCLGIALWRGVGGGTRTHFSEKHLQIPSKVVQFLLKQSPAVSREAERFKRTHLSGRQYIAVQIRGEKVVIRHNLIRLKKCLYLLVNIIQVLKESYGIRKVFLASDMSNYGSGSWEYSLRGEIYDNNTLHNIHRDLIARTGAVVYKPAAGQESQDRGAVSLVEMSLVSQAVHVITVGSGSFQEWVVAKFLELHRDDSQQLWSLTRMCLNG